MRSMRRIAVLVIAMVSLSPGFAKARDIAFNQDWQFQRAPDGTLPAMPDAAAWATVRLPHTTRIEPRVVNDQWQGISFYEKRFTVPENWRGQTVLMRFEAAMNVADVQVNGATVAHHDGGFLPFTIDLTPYLMIGAEAVVTVRLDNRDNPLTGPKPLKRLDFNTYGGLYRGVTLKVVPPLHLSDEMLADRVAGGGLFVTYPEVSADSATVRIAADVRNAGASAGSATVLQQVLDGETLVGEASGALTIGADAIARSDQAIRISNPKLWSPKAPQLYELVTTITSSDGAADVTRRMIGIRRIGFDDGQFVINGERMFLRGVNRHQEYPYIGYALSPEADYRDAKRIKQAGFDYVRLSHYPQSPTFMDAADELGLVLLDAVPGWQYFNPDPKFTEYTLNTCRDLIRRDRNHPSVIAWECSLNETTMPDDLIAGYHRIVHAEYPGDQTFSAGWQPQIYDIYLQARQHRLQHYETPTKPYNVSEYGDWEYYALNAGFAQDKWEGLKEDERTSRQPLGAGEARLLQQATNVQEAQNDNLHTPAYADSYWAMFDYNRGYADDLESSGTMSIERLPKFSYWYFASQRGADEAPGAVVKIASYWTAASTPSVRVFSNADEVELFLNGRSIGRKPVERTRISDRLAHPPFEFFLGGFAPGELRAVAYRAGQPVAADSVFTPGEATRLCTVIDDAGVAAGVHDPIFARARLIDDRGHLVPVADARAVTFSASGDWAMIGPATVMSEAGIASTLIERTTGTGPGAVEAQTEGLTAIGVCPG